MRARRLWPSRSCCRPPRPATTTCWAQALRARWPPLLRATCWGSWRWRRQRSTRAWWPSSACRGSWRALRQVGWGGRGLMGGTQHHCTLPCLPSHARTHASCTTLTRPSVAAHTRTPPAVLSARSRGGAPAAAAAAGNGGSGSSAATPAALALPYVAPFTACVPEILVAVRQFVTDRCVCMCVRGRACVRVRACALLVACCERFRCASAVGRLVQHLTHTGPAVVPAVTSHTATRDTHTRTHTHTAAWRTCVTCTASGSCCPLCSTSEIGC
jgi:hypothetical protein